MFYVTSEQYCYDLLYTVAKDHFEGERSLETFRKAYRAWVRSKQTRGREPASPGVGVHFCDDAALERELVSALYARSPLDDFEHYRDPSQLNLVGEDRTRVSTDAAHAARRHAEFEKRDPAFWRVFGLYVEYVACVASRYSSGGTNSNALGVIYLSNARRHSPKTLYEIFVHELTHLMMFVDEHRQRHYLDDEALADPANFSVSAVYEMERPLDKTLHSVVVATEVLLHRDRVIGHDGDHAVHPASPKLAATTLAAADALLALQAKRTLLAPRGLALVERCKGHVTELLERNRPAKVA